MPDERDAVDEAIRQLTICNACRYCEQYCAVFPAVELRRVIAGGDIEYFASLCHDCRDCLHACQYAPPHAFAVNIPRVLGEAREASYARRAGGGAFGRRLRGMGAPGLALALAVLLVAAGLVGVRVVLGRGLFATETGAGAFYRVVPEPVLDVVFLALGIFWLARWAASARASARAAGPRRTRPALADHLAAARDAILLRYLSGGGAGCDHRGERPSQSRRLLHQMVLGGFTLDLVATALAAVYDHVYGLRAPYPLLSPVVVLGVLGGVGLIAGCAGLLVQRRGADRRATTEAAAQGAQAFTATLLLVALTGMLVLGVRSTPLMPIALVVHLATVATLFLTAPYGRFVHAALRYVALVRFHQEQRLDRALP